jgi:lysophospholipase L1-like esterase
VVIPPGREVLSDALPFATHSLERVAVSLYLPEGSTAPTQHGVGLETGFVVAGDQTAAADFKADATIRSRFFLTDVEVLGDAGSSSLMVLGDSISDGVGSAFGRDARWPDVLAARLRDDRLLARVGVGNAGISGNRLLNDAEPPFVGPSGLSRFSRDVLEKPSLRWLVLFEGINDIAAGPLLKTPRDEVSAAQIIAGLRALVTRAHAHRVAVVGATLLPTGGAGEPFDTPLSEAKRQEVNAWIRSACVFDAVADLDSALRDPAAAARLRPEFDSGDHLHPNDGGHQAIAEAVHGALRSLVFERRHADTPKRHREVYSHPRRCAARDGQIGRF